MVWLIDSPLWTVKIKRMTNQHLLTQRLVLIFLSSLTEPPDDTRLTHSFFLGERQSDRRKVANYFCNSTDPLLHQDLPDKDISTEPATSSIPVVTLSGSYITTISLGGKNKKITCFCSEEHCDVLWLYVLLLWKIALIQLDNSKEDSFVQEDKSFWE